MKKNATFPSKAASLFTIAIGFLALAGWIFNIPSLKSILPGIISIKFNTAVCFILSGIALYMVEMQAGNRYYKTIATICSWVILVAGILNFSEYIFGINLGIDELLWKEGPGTVATTYPGRMSLSTSLNFILLGSILLMLGKKKYHWPIQVLLMAMIPGSLLVIFNHLFGVSFLSAVPQLGNTALATAILFIVLCVGIFFSSALGYLRFSFMKKVIGFFVLILLVRSLIFFALNKNIEQTTDTHKWLEHKHEVLLMAEKLNTQCNEIQSITRGYIITGEEYFLPVISNKADSIDNILNRLRTITKVNTHQQLRIDTLQKHLGTFITSQRELLTIRRNKGFDAAKKIVLNGQAKLLFNNIHTVITRIEQDEDQQLASRKTQNEQLIHNSSQLFTIFQLIAVLLMLAVIKLIYNNTRFRNKAEEALKNSLKDLSDFKYAMDEASIVAITNHKGIIKQVNENLCNISKYSREELIGQDHRILNSGYHAKEFMGDLWATITRGNVWKGEIKNKAKDGTFYWVDSTIVPFLNDEGKPYQYLAIRSDITQRKVLETEILQFNQELQKRVEDKTKEVIEKEQQYRFLLQNMREGIQVIGHDWKYLFVNNTVEQQAKYSNKEMIGHTIMEKYSGNENLELFKVLRRCMKERCTEIFETEFTFPDATKGWFELSIQPVPEGLFILSMDITERKKAEIALAESENYLRTIIQAEPECVKLLGINGELQDMNQAGLSMIEADDLGQVKGKSLLGIIDKPYKKAYEVLIQNIFKGIPGKIEFEITGMKGAHRWMETHAVPLKSIEGKIVSLLGVTRDITERKKAEEIIVKERDLSNSIINSLPGIFYLFDETGKYLRWNKNLETVSGYSAAEISQLHPLDMFDADVKHRLENKIAEAFNSGTADIEAPFLTKAKEKIPYYFNGWRVNYEGKTCLIGVGIDITERKNIEKKIKQQNKELAVSNTELEQFAYVASHDLQEPLRMVTSFLNLLEKRMEGQLNDTNKKYIHFAVDGAMRMKTLIQDLLLYSKVGINKESFTATNLNEVLLYVTQLLEEDIKKPQALITVKSMPFIKVNKTLISQLFVNLVSNALKYHGGKQPEIEVGCKEDADNYIFYVKDDGIGIDHRYFDKIFIIFQRLHNKDEYSGTGIGLAICKKIVEIHNGKIWVESEPGKGSTFYFSVPKQNA